MENQRPVVCPENEELAMYVWKKRQEMAEQPKGLLENNDKTVTKAYFGVCNSKVPIKTLKDFYQVKGVGKWVLKLMQGFFETTSGCSEPEDLINQGKKTKKTRSYLPKMKSASYALLITLYRGTASGNEFMRKQELIDAAEASGLSQVPIVPEKGKGKPSQFGSSAKDWYSGWCCMKTLITKGLVVKSSCPAKYMLTQEGQEAARTCLIKSGLPDPMGTSLNVYGFNQETLDASNMQIALADSENDDTLPSHGPKKLIDVPPESLERFTRMGYSKDEVLCAFAEVVETSQNKEISLLWPSVLCHLREKEVYDCDLESQTLKEDCLSRPVTTFAKGQVDHFRSENHRIDVRDGEHIPKSALSSFSLRACPSSSSSDGLGANTNILNSPPLSSGERFEDVYQVILILDDREQFATRGSRSHRIIDNICSEFKIQIEVRRLPVGDAIWIVRHKYLSSEYVLDFIVERKKVDDLRCSIRDKRYKDQKLRLLRCGLKKLIYLLEGDPNSSEGAESIKTACFTTEILEGFDVHRTYGLGDTLRKYGHLTHAITECYKSKLPERKFKCAGVCPSYHEFIVKCTDLEKITVSDVFAIQLMQVPQVTEEIAITVLDLYPTLISLAHAYSVIDGEVNEQEELLRKQSNNVISTIASKNIFQFVWGN